jgi:hypothetical protein
MTKLNPGEFSNVSSRAARLGMSNPPRGGRTHKSFRVSRRHFTAGMPYSGVFLPRMGNQPASRRGDASCGVAAIQRRRGGVIA